MKLQNPIFIIGTERSGSNLLRLLLNAHPAIAIPHPPHIFRYFHPLLPDYGDLALPSHFEALVDDILRFIKTHIYPWEITVDRAKLLEEAHARSLLGIMAGVYNQYLEYSGKSRWGCKSTFMIDHAPEVAADFPAAQFIWLIRDPRDVAVSSRTSVFNPFHPYFTASLWRRQQALGLQLERRMPRNTFLRITYEDLISRPGELVPSICEFLQEEFNPVMMDYYKTDSAVKSSSLSESWQNLASPILANNSKKYRKSLSPDEIFLVEQVAGEVMAELGYELEHPELGRPRAADGAASDWRPELYRWLWYKTLDSYWSLKAEYRSLRNDRNHWLRWRRGIFMTQLKWSLEVGRLRSCCGRS